MSRFRLFLLTVAAAMAVGAVASSSASAVSKQCKEAGSNRWVFCYDSGLEIGTPAQEVLGTSGLSLLAGVVGGAELKVHCPKDDFNGELELLGKSKGLLRFLECTIIKPATGCALNPTTVHALFTAELINHPNAAEIEFTGSKNTATKEFATLTIVGATCAIPPGNYTVTGTQKCKLPNSGTSLVVHEIECLKAGSNLKLGGNSASFSSTAKVHLGSPNLGLAWYVDLGF